MKSPAMECPVCHEQVRPHERHCVACQTDCGFPNVRAASEDDEQQALDQRVREAENRADANGTRPILDKLRAAAGRTKAVRVRSLGDVYALVQRDDQLFGTFHDLKGAGLLRPSATEIEASRQSAEPLVFLNYHERIQFAALTLDDQAPFNYGNCAMVFQEAKIAHRATVFEENCVLFCRRHHLGPAQPTVPPGHRATWERRADLIVAKLGPRLVPGSNESGFAALLLSIGSDPTQDDFVEVHIYERIHRSALEYVVVKVTRASDDTVIEDMKSILGGDRVRTV